MTVGGGVQTTRIVIIDNEPLMRDLLARVLSEIEGFEVTTSLTDHGSAMGVIDAYQPNVALMDLSPRPGRDEITLGRAVRRRHPEIGILILTGSPDIAVAREIILGEGAGWSYLLKRSVADVDSLARAIRDAASGMTVIDPVVIAGLRPTHDSPLTMLTPRQTNVLELVARGFSNESIAGHLELSRRTIEHHLNEIYQQFQVCRAPEMNARLHAALLYLRDPTVRAVA